MGKYICRIKLLSDLCVSDGGVYNSSLDQDICCSNYGFPYIPAKRLKGCLRESALELRDWGENIPMDTLFGKKNEATNAGCLRFENAILEDSVQYREEIERSSSALYHRQNVLDQYSYIRMQTAVNRESGTAKPKSMRNMRVANRGLEFTANLTWENQSLSDEEALKILQKICTNLTGMGMTRTRGLGEVLVTVEKAANEDQYVKDAIYTEGADLLTYELYLREPVICKSVAGGEQSTQDYIEGSKMLGLVAERYRKATGEELTSLLDDSGAVFSNAYISEQGRRYAEVPGYVYAIKNCRTSYINKLQDADNTAGGDRQLNRMKHIYVQFDGSGKLRTKSVDIERRYHHRRPEDKSIGRAAAEASGDSNFYQMSSITAGQYFRGYITGRPEVIREIYGLLKSEKNCRLGYSRTAEYGACEITQVLASVCDKSAVRTDQVLVTLKAPAICYNEKATYSTDAKDLAAEAAAAMGLSVEGENAVTIDIVQKYIKYTYAGGYNVTWNQRKPSAEIFDKGTVLLLRFGELCNIPTGEGLFLGERTMEGYGEFSVEAFRSGQPAEYSIEGNNIDSAVNPADKNRKTSGQTDLTKNPLGSRIAESLLEDYLLDCSIGLAKKYANEKYRPVVSNMLLMCSENTAYEGVKAFVEERYGKKSDNKADKLSRANEILETVNKNMDSMIAGFEDQYGVAHVKEQVGDIRLMFLRILLQQIKYIIRNTSGNEGRKGERA